MIRYKFALDLQERMLEIARKLEFSHIKPGSVVCMRSQGSLSRGTIARCHALNRIMQKALGRDALYVLEFISERFDKLAEEDKIKTIIHELMHIPKSFGGGFRHHDYVRERNISQLYKKFYRISGDTTKQT